MRPALLILAALSAMFPGRLAAEPSPPEPRPVHAAVPGEFDPQAYLADCEQLVADWPAFLKAKDDVDRIARGDSP